MKDIIYIVGDATKPQGSGNKIIAHVCNNIGAWGAGFVLALNNKWSEPEIKYKQWYRESINCIDRDRLELRKIQLVPVEKNIIICSMIAQNNIRNKKTDILIDYEALKECLSKLANVAENINASVHMPRIGCGLAGGKWEKVEPIIIEELCEKDIQVTVYDLPI